MVDCVRQNYKINCCKFNETKKQLIAVLGTDFQIEHVGSTAIPQMWGKNIIDILVGVKEIAEIEKAAAKIETLGFRRGHHNNAGEYIFFASKEEETRSGDIHIHLSIQKSQRFDDFLLLKKYLLNHPDAAKEYILVKRNLAKLGYDRTNYRNLKSKYVEELLKKARTQI